MIDFAQSGSGYDYSLALHAGDIVYSTGYLQKWNLFNNRLAGLADRTPYLLGQGNHGERTKVLARPVAAASAMRSSLYALSSLPPPPPPTRRA